MISYEVLSRFSGQEADQSRGAIIRLLDILEISHLSKVKTPLKLRPENGRCFFPYYTLTDATFLCTI